MSSAYTGVKPHLGFWQIWNMCFGFFGIQFGWTLQMNNMSAIYEYLGASPEQIPGLWLAAPMTGLLVQPIIGYLSDRTWHPRLGRRRPFFLVGAILSSIALFFMPNAPAIWIAAGTLWILDSSINISMEPFRAFVADNLNEKQRSFGFAMQSMFIGLAAFVAGYLPQKLAQWAHVSRESVSGSIPENIKLSFYIGGAVLLIAVLYTIIKSKEYPPTDAGWKTKKGSGGTVKGIFSSIAGMPSHMEFAAGRVKIRMNMLTWPLLLLKLFDGLPSQMKRLALVNFITWPGLFLMWFYYSTGVATDIFGGNAKTNSIVYTQGLEYAGTTSAILNLVTFAFSFSLPFWVKQLGKKGTHTACLVIGGIGLIAVKQIHEPWMLYVAMGMVGIAWASILSMPYSMLASCLPPDKIGIYMGVFNFFIVLPEIIASLFFGKIMTHLLHDDRLLAVRVGGFLLCIAALVCALIIKEDKNE